ESQALVFAFLSALASRGSELIRLACSAVLVRAHYREAHRDDKGFFTKKKIVRSDMQQSGSISLSSPPFRSCIGFKLNI
ncbi:hypothetical protein, partial [Aeromonas dhakensis]|uniref:hypothetical protein n=1 Tax=Aeromonas dhakensis TaxID=196024 RepID=UPI003B9E8B7A